jgi:hypothetical protein
MKPPEKDFRNGSTDCGGKKTRPLRMYLKHIMLTKLSVSNFEKINFILN